jgi:hypothetical protein
MLKATYTMVNTTSAVVWGVTSPYLGVVGGGVRGVRQRGVVKALREVEEALNIVEGHVQNGDHNLRSRVGRHVTIPESGGGGGMTARGGVRGVRQRGVVKALKEVEEAFDIVEGHAHNGEHHLGSRVGRHVTIPGGEGWGRGWGGGEGVDEVSRQA